MLAILSRTRRSAAASGGLRSLTRYQHEHSAIQAIKAAFSAFHIYLISQTSSRNDRAPRARFCQCRDLGLRPRQHALSASPESLAAGRRAHPRLHRRFFEDHPRRGVPAAEGLLQALWHHHARADGGARPATGRIFGDGAPDRSLAADAEPGARRGDRATLRPQAHSDQWHPRACRRGVAPARDRTSFRRRVRHPSGRTRTEAQPVVYERFLPATTSIRTRPRSSRTSPAISKCRTRSA